MSTVYIDTHQFLSDLNEPLSMCMRAKADNIVFIGSAPEQESEARWAGFIVEVLPKTEGIPRGAKRVVSVPGGLIVTNMERACFTCNAELEDGEDNRDNHCSKCRNK